MNKIKNFLKSPQGEVAIGTFLMVFLFTAFYIAMWTADIIGILN